MKRAVVLNCSSFVLICLQPLDILKGGAERKKKKSLKRIINQQNKRKRKGRRSERNQLKQNRKNMAGPHAPWPHADLTSVSEEGHRANAKASLPNGANKL